MHIDVTLTAAGLLVGLLVGLTGMGGGAVLTPLLVLVFGVPPLVAVSSDLVTSLVMKPVGAFVHLRRRTVQMGLVSWLAVGSVPAGFVGATIIGQVGQSPRVESGLKAVIGVALVFSLIATTARLVLDRRRGTPAEVDARIVVRRGLTICIGVIGGLAVGVTSVGAGSLIIAMLLLTYPRLRPAQLVGTDLLQAIPLVASAALGHLLFGEVQLSLTVSLLVGAIPGVYVGAKLSSRAPAGFTRPIIAGVLAASALALLGAPGVVALVCAGAAALLVQQLGRPAASRPTGAGPVPAVPAPRGEMQPETRARKLTQP